MLIGIEYRNPIGPDLKREQLEPCWAEYFDYESSAPSLHMLIEAQLQSEVKQARQLGRPYLNSQQTISRILTTLGARGTFHRQFHDLFPNYRPYQVLGMHLFVIMARDENLWVYTQNQHKGHAFPHSVYFIPERDSRYEAALARA